VGCRRRGFRFADAWFPVVEVVVGAIDDADERDEWGSIVGAQWEVSA
jgi:hypothetical protein